MWDLFAEGDRIAVYKLDSNNRPSGTALKNYAKGQEGEARAFVRSLYAKADEETKQIGRAIKERLDPFEVGYLSPRAFGWLDTRKYRTGVTILKGADNLRLMFIVTSNSYLDRDKETITTKALGRYVDKAWAVEDKCLPDNVLLFWHKGEPIGDIIWTDMEGPFLIEVAKERPNKQINLTAQGKSHKTTVRDMWDAIESATETWGASHGFRYPESAKSSDGTYHYIAKFETSILPQRAASNPYTFAGVINDMDRDTYLDQLLARVPGVKAKQIREGIAKLNTALQKQGLTHKDKKDAEQVAVKGLLEDLSAKIDKVLSGITDNPDPAIRDAIIAVITEALSTASAETAVAPLEDVVVDPVQEDIAEQGKEDEPMPQITEETMNKMFRFMERVIATNEQLAEDNKANRESIKAIGETVKALQNVATLPGELEKLETRQKAMEDRLTGAPRRASQSTSTVVKDEKLTEQVKKQMERFEEPLPGLKLKAGG